MKRALTALAAIALIATFTSTANAQFGGQDFEAKMTMLGWMIRIWFGGTFFFAFTAATGAFFSMLTLLRIEKQNKRHLAEARTQSRYAAQTWQLREQVAAARAARQR